MADVMRSALRSIGLATLLGLLATTAHAGCPEGQREFRGAISAINPQKLFVDSRLDDNIGFARAAETKIVDEAGKGRVRWDQLQPGDAVVICWRFEDRPRKALSISVR
jgi:hypothetical protein